MKRKEQVLSITQVQELKELGFDVNKHASVEINTTINKNQYVVSSSFVQLYPQFGDDNVIERYTTMTIGDIMECLPVEIEEEILNIFAFGETWSVGWEGIQYWGSNTLIDALFETLKWCIKEKHIEL